MKKSPQTQRSSELHYQLIISSEEARTSTAILRLDAEHNESVIRFLTDSGLAGTPASESSINLFREIDLSEANLSDIPLPNADLREADLSGANLSNAFLDDANLSGADLGKADLHEALASGTNLRGADGITNEELDQQAASLEGATMPNAQKYEDWLKSKDSENKKSGG